MTKRRVNHQPPVVNIGDGVTYSVGSDAYPYTVIGVERNNRKLILQSDHAVRVDNNGMSESQEYDITPDPEGSIIEVTWKPSLGCYGNQYSRYYVGHRRKHRDPHF
jgi:hypothetical protein